MRVSSIKFPLVCVSFTYCIIYFVYHISKAGHVKQEITPDTAGTIRKEIFKFVARNITRSTDKFDCFLGRRQSEIDLMTQRLPGDNQLSPDTNAKKALFYERLLPKEKVEYRDLIKTFSEGVPANITYFLYAGALLGSYSHHGMIPWDDDLDIMVRQKDQPLLQTFLQSLGPKYEHNTDRAVNWKFYHKTSPKAGPTAWKWPFIDIFFYSEHPSFIQEGRAAKNKFNKNDVFPLIKRPFMGMMLPAPRHTRKVLELNYNIDLCVSNSYDHRLEKDVLSKCVVKLPCHLLKDKFPFVTRKNSNNIYVEVLETGHGNQSVYETTNID